MFGQPQDADYAQRRLAQHSASEKITLVKAHDERGDPEGAHAAALRVFLLNAGDVLGDVLHRRRVLKREPIALAFDARAVDEDAGVGGEARKGEDDVLVELVDLAHGARVLQLRSRLALYCKHNVVFAAHADSGRALAHRFHCILHLKEMAVRREDGDRAVIARHRTKSGPETS